MKRLTGYLTALLIGSFGMVQAATAGVDALRGLAEIEVAVVGMSQQLLDAGFDRDRIYDDIERQLRSTRLQVNEFRGGSVGGDLPVLQVVPECSTLQDGGTLCSVVVELLELVSPTRDMTLQLVVPTWRWSWSDEVERASKVGDMIDSAIGQFTDDYYAVN